MNLLVFGLGYSAQHFVHLYAHAFEHVAGTVRDRAAPRPLAGATEILHFGSDGASPEIEERLGQADVILVSVAPGTSVDPVLARYGRRLAGIKRAQKILYLSTIGVYGDRGGEWVDETRVPRPASERSKVRIHAEKAWLALAEDRQGGARAALVRHLRAGPQPARQSARGQGAPHRQARAGLQPHPCRGHRPRLSPRSSRTRCRRRLERHRRRAGAAAGRRRLRRRDDGGGRRRPSRSSTPPT